MDVEILTTFALYGFVSSARLRLLAATIPQLDSLIEHSRIKPFQFDNGLYSSVYSSDILIEVI